MQDGLHRHHKLLFFKVGLSRLPPHQVLFCQSYGSPAPSWLTDRQNRVERPLLHGVASPLGPATKTQSPRPSADASSSSDSMIALAQWRGVAACFSRSSKDSPWNSQGKQRLGLGQSPHDGLRYVLAPGAPARKTNRCYTGRFAPSLEPYLQVTPSYKSKIRACSIHDKIYLPRMGLGASATGVFLTGCLRTPLGSKC